MDATATIAISLFAIGISALVVIRLNRRDDASDEITYGDYPAIPEEMRGAAQKPGGGQDGAAPALVRTDNVIARRHTAGR